MNQSDPLKLKILKKVKHLADRTFFPKQDRVSTYLYYLSHQFANRRFMSTVEFIFITLTWAKTIPRKFDIIIGIPRNGMIPAYLLGIELGIPVATIETFQNNNFQVPTSIKKKAKYKHILLVDENIGTGNQMRKAKEKLLLFNPKLKISTAAPFVRADQAKNIDYYYAINKGAILATELDLTKSPLTINPICSDLDGVLCEEMPLNIKEEDKPNFMKNAKPNKIPIFEIDTVATGREEKYRDVTERWLSRNNVKYKSLVMAKDGEDGITTKVNVIRKVKPGIFWESDMYQSRIIYLKTGCRVLCTQNMYLYGGNQYDYIKKVLP